MFDKSLVSNCIAVLLVVVGLVIEGAYRPFVLNTGLFALSGGITNWLAVHMLFERVPGLYGSGVIPLRFEEFKTGIRRLIMEQFFDRAQLSEYLGGDEAASNHLLDKLRQAVEELDLDRAFDSLLDVIMNSSFASMLGMLGGRKALEPLKEPFVRKMREHFQDEFVTGGFEEQIRNALQSAMDDSTIRERLEDMIDERLNQMTPTMVKEIIQTMIRKHLGWLVVWGCAFGGAIGLIITAVSYL